VPSVTETSSAAAAAQAVSKTNLSVRRYRKSVTGLTAVELSALRSALTRMIALSDDRGFGFWAGIHGLPLPISCTHGSPLFLPWHRAYLYYFEQHLLDQMPSGQAVSLPWWDSRGPVQRRERAAGRPHLPSARPRRPGPGTGRAAQRPAGGRGPGPEGLRRLHRAAGTAHLPVSLVCPVCDGIHRSPPGRRERGLGSENHGPFGRKFLNPERGVVLRVGTRSGKHTMMPWSELGS
jgi:Common central domain of tyrosinase